VGIDIIGATTKPIELTATLMGTAEVLTSNTEKKTIFQEDLTPAEIKAEEQRELMNSMKNVAAMIPAIQVPPLNRQPENVNDDDDCGMSMVSDVEEIRAYDRLVHGFSQHRIDALLRLQQNPQGLQSNRGYPRAMPPLPHLLGKVVMTMGLELQRSYVNDLAVLNEDGTLVSGLDNGHIQMWKHGRRVGDIVHQSAGGFGGFGAFTGVDSVLALDNAQGSPASFATAGKGCIRVWDSEGEHLLGRPSPLPYASPTGLVQIPMGSAEGYSLKSNILCLASRFRITRPPSRRPRLVPQDNAGRGRVAEIESSEALVNERLTRLSESVQILFADTGTVRNSGSTGARNTAGISTNGANTPNTVVNAPPMLRSSFLKSPSPVMALASWEDGDVIILAVGDEQGGVMFWKIDQAAPQPDGSSAPRLTYTKLKYLWITSIENPAESRSAIVCMKYTKETRQLFVSTRQIPSTRLSDSPSAGDVLRDVPITCFPIKPAQAVHCIDVDPILSNTNVDPLIYTLDGHKDIVHCVLPLPNGDILTAGGKLDAMTKVWSRTQLREALTRTGEKFGSSDDLTVFTDNMGVQHSSPPPILRQADTTNLCKDAGYIFSAELLKDFKSQSEPEDSLSSRPRTNIPFAIAVARYNVVKIVL